MTRRWHDGLKVGIDQIDEDHRHLFSILAALDDLIHSGGAVEPERVDAVLTQMAEYAGQHFAREEAMQEEVGFDGFGDNRRQHVELTLTLEAFIAKYRAGGLGKPTVAAEKILEFLTIWIEEHIIKTDLQMRGRILPWAG
jgi:hemerythrin